MDNAIVIKVATCILRCMTTISFSDFVDASKDVNGQPLIGQTALKKLYRWHEANALNSMSSGDKYHAPRWDNGTEITRAEISDLRSPPFPAPRLVLGPIFDLDDFICIDDYKDRTDVSSEDFSVSLPK